MENDKEIAERVVEVLNDLQIQSMLFDMDIDIETLTLIERVEYKEQPWVSKWKAKRQLPDAGAEDAEQVGW